MASFGILAGSSQRLTSLAPGPAYEAACCDFDYVDHVAAGDSGRRLISYAGNAEDIVLVRAFADRRDGFFVDVGAGEPVRSSLTKNLVDVLGWRGANVEALPERAARLRGARPRDTTLEVAVGVEPGIARFFRILPGPGQPGERGLGLSTLRSDVRDMHVAAGWRFEELRVEVVTLESVLRAHAEPGFDLLKVDVEGSEAEVLASADLAHWRPRALVVEATVPLTTRPSHQEWEPGVLAAGYELVLFDGLNRFYVRAGENVLRERMSVPADVADDYISLDDAIRAGLVT